MRPASAEPDRENSRDGGKIVQIELDFKILRAGHLFFCISLTDSMFTGIQIASIPLVLTE